VIAGSLGSPQVWDRRKSGEPAEFPQPAENADPGCETKCSWLPLQTAGATSGSAIVNTTPILSDPIARLDEKIVRTLANLEKLAERGDADQQIAPWRDRLAQLRPTRPLTLLRLMCEPFDPLIVPGHRWHRGSPGIPRTALGPLGRVVRAGLADTATGIDAAVAGHTSDAIEVVAAIGPQLWPRAAEILATAAMPADWATATGLGASDHANLSRAAAAVLAQAVSLQRLTARAWGGAEPETRELQTMLAAVFPAGPVAIAMMVVLLMASLPSSQRLIRLADELASRQNFPAGRAMADGAIDFALDSLEDAPLRGTNVAQATRHMRCAVIMLSDLDSHSARHPVRRVRIERVRRKLDTACRKRFAIELDTRLLTPAAAMAITGDAEIATLAAAAHALREFCSTARQIGSGDQYDALLRRAAEALRPTATDAAPASTHRIRLVEILLGHEAAPAQ